MSLAYLDHAATSPVRPEVAEAYAKDLVDFSGLGTNPASTHSSGRRAAGALRRVVGETPVEGGIGRPAWGQCP